MQTSHEQFKNIPDTVADEVVDGVAVVPDGPVVGCRLDVEPAKIIHFLNCQLYKKVKYYYLMIVFCETSYKIYLYANVSIEVEG